MLIAHTIADCRAARSRLGRLALVPTMGALHQGHLALIRHAGTLAPHRAVSIFVNPTQFAPGEDYARYPRPIETDLQLCRECGVDLVFHPDPHEMYGPAPTPIIIDIPHLTEPLEGKHRPGHFRGVCQVVAKLFNIIQPDIAVFGLKDFQQCCVIRAMTRLLNFPVEIATHPTVRDPDGLALSSRNAYLSPDERRRALAISRALREAELLAARGVNQTSRLLATMQRIIMDPGDLGRIPLSIDYIAAVHPDTLVPIEVLAGPTLLAVAARVGATRLIDNTIVHPP